MGKKKYTDFNSINKSWQLLPFFLSPIFYLLYDLFEHPFFLVLLGCSMLTIGIILLLYCVCIILCAIEEKSNDYYLYVFYALIGIACVILIIISAMLILIKLLELL